MKPPDPQKSDRPVVISIENVSKTLGSTRVLEQLSLTIHEGEFFTLLGPSGCGKTTLLRIIAGLENADAGLVTIAGRDARTWPAHDRPVNTVFQSYALFPHMTVWNNTAFGLRMKRVQESEIAVRVKEALALVEAGQLQDRMPAQLSGGQKQRVALARALVNRPKVLLLDEPLSALDLKLRHQLRSELLPLQRRLGATFLYVTHDQEEAFALSDRIAILQTGSLAQVGTPTEIYENPGSRQVAEFLGEWNFLEASANADGSFTTDVGRFEASDHSSASEASCCLGIRPERIQVLELNSQASSPNAIQATVRETRLLGGEIRYTFCVNGVLLKSRCLVDGSRKVWREGDQVTLVLPPGSLKRFPLAIHEA
ncbi:MAG: ABC transporter ATP-binding protein [Verrucomicrobia bacterium]|nr:ABC transporter ATP-binding protein [Verrucomicrobiota bacterium]